MEAGIIHAGVYFGDFLPAVSRAVGPNAIIWGFEPNKENYECAVITRRLNSLENVKLVNAGLGAETDVKQMLISNKGVTLGGGCRITDKLYTEGVYVNVDVVSIDSQIPEGRHVSILQLDVEQYEKEVLEGAMKTITRCRPIIIVEGLSDEAWLSRTLFALGYSVKGKLHNDTILAVTEK